MATPIDNIVMPWLCVCPPEHRVEISSLEARRIFEKLGELHQPLRPRPAKNPGLDRPCEQRPNMVLEAFVLHRERPKAELVPFGIL
jgi:hypothetical protein